MRPASRAVLAREAASRAAAAELSEARCAGQGRRLSALEREHRAAGPDDVAAVVQRLRAEFCGGCPILLGCGQWAHVEGYTGLAAGAAYELGQRHQATWAPPKAGRERRPKPTAGRPTETTVDRSSA